MNPIFGSIAALTLRVGGGHGGRVLTLSPPTSKVGVRLPAYLKWESW